MFLSCVSGVTWLAVSLTSVSTNNNNATLSSSLFHTNGRKCCLSAKGQRRRKEHKRQRQQQQHKIGVHTPPPRHPIHGTLQRRIATEAHQRENVVLVRLVIPVSQPSQVKTWVTFLEIQKLGAEVNVRVLLPRRASSDTRRGTKIGTPCRSHNLARIAETMRAFENTLLRVVSGRGCMGGES